MNIQKAQYGENNEFIIITTKEGKILTVPVDTHNRYYEEILTQKIDILPYEPPSKDYIILREKSYPSIGDQLDAIWKELNNKRLAGENLVSDADDMLGQILAVKKKYPKPTENKK